MTLPGMPIQRGDPGLFVCKIDDGAPRTRGPAAPTARPPAPRAHVWLVLALCPICLPAPARYCSEHNAQNWWLTKWGTAVKKETRPVQPLTGNGGRVT